MRAVTVTVALVVAVVLGGCSSGTSGRTTASSRGGSREVPMSISLKSALFADAEMIPTRSTCDGQNLSPPLAWTGTPSETVEQALTMEDPDAPSGTFVHWVLWGLPAGVHELDEGVVPKGVHQGRNSAGTNGYTGPCPPKGDRPHRYIFTVYALSAPVSIPDGSSIGQLRAAMDSKVLDEGRLTGRYAR